MSESDKIDIIAAILTSATQIQGSRSGPSAAALAVVRYRRIKHMLTVHGTDALPPIEDDKYYNLYDLLDLDKPLEANSPTK
jgi:hypothetical protein